MREERKEKWKTALRICSVLVPQGGENTVVFSKLTFKTPMIQCSHGYIILVTEKKKIYIHHLGSFGVLMSELLKVIIRTKV